jgi:ferritin-like metal-binding protein YciE
MEGGSMSQSEQKVVQYLGEAHASELALMSVLRSQIAMTPRGSYREALERHLEETRGHAERVQRRLRELRGGANPMQAALGITEGILGQVLALSKTPLDLLRGSGGEEKVLKNAKDAAASEALEIATYTALERLAQGVGDEQTARLAASIRAEEQRMLERIMREIPKLTDAVVGSDIEGESSYEIGETGAADGARRAAGELKRSARSTTTKAKRTARSTTTQAKRTARQARKIPGVAQLEGQAKGAVASEQDLAIPRYDALSAEEIIGRLPRLSQIDLAKVDSYERRNQNRSTVLSRITSLRGEEPWPGYDELNVSEIEALLGDGDRGRDEKRIERVRSYERSHKNRASVIALTERETARA